MAGSFRKAFERCFEEKPLPDGKFEMLAIPGIVNAAFSIELYLKYILTKQITGHDLNKLFNELEDKQQKAIIDKTGFTEIDFKNLLNHHKDNFIEWRYLFEKANIQISTSTDFMRKLIKSCEEYIKENNC